MMWMHHQPAENTSDGREKKKEKEIFDCRQHGVRPSTRRMIIIWAGLARQWIYLSYSRKSEAHAGCHHRNPTDYYFWNATRKMQWAWTWLLRSYHFYRRNSNPGITDNPRFWTCTSSSGRGHSYQSAYAFCPYRTACDNWDMFRHQLFRFPIFYESLVDLEWENKTNGINKSPNSCFSTSMHKIMNVLVNGTGPFDLFECIFHLRDDRRRILLHLFEHFWAEDQHWYASASKTCSFHMGLATSGNIYE